MLKQIIIISIVILMAGCSSIKLNPDAQTVRLTLTEPTKECKFLGDVIGSQGDAFTGAYTTNKKMEVGAMNDIKNQAAALGGNLVVILTQRAGQTGSYGEYGRSSMLTNVTITGNVYSCPK